MMDLEAVQVSNYLRSHPDFVEEWLSRNADSALLEAVRIKWSKQPKPHSPPITIQRPQSQPQNENEGNSKTTDHDEKAGVNIDDNDDDDDDIADDNEISKLDLEAIKKAAEAVLEDDLDDTLHVEPSPSSVVPRCGRKSVTSDLFHQWLASGSASNNTRVTSLPSPNNVVASSTTLQPNPTEIIDQTDKLIEYILDISNELDINVLVRTICI